MKWVTEVAHLTGCFVTVFGALLVFWNHPDGVAICAIGAGLAGGSNYFKMKQAGQVTSGEEPKP